MKHKVSRPICDYEGSRYSSVFWGKGREYEDQVERIALRGLLPPHSRALLDIVAGFGRLADLYRGANRVVLLDYSLSQLREAQERFGADERFLFVAADLYNLPFVGNLFDTTVMVRVIHHIVDVPGAFREIHRVTEPGGKFILEYANKRHLKAILRYFLRFSRVNPFSQEPYEFAPLHFDFHPAYIEGELQRAGFKVTESLSVSFFRVPWLKRHIPLSLLVSLDARLQKPLAPLRLTPSVLLKSVARKGEANAPRGFFRCPRCGSERLQEGSSALLCPQCRAAWEIQDGIYNFKNPRDF